MPDQVATHLSCAAWFAAGMLVAGAARAEELGPEAAPIRRFRVVYDMRADRCPGSSELVRQIEARSAIARLASRDEPAVTLEVTLLDAPGGAAGHLRVADAKGTEVARDVHAESCEEVVGGLALIAAVTLDPDAMTAPLTEATGRTGPVPTPSAEGSAENAPRPSPAPGPETTPPPSPGPRASPEEKYEWRGLSGLHAVLVGGVSPDPLVGGGAFLGVRHGPPSGIGWAARVEAQTTPPSVANLGSAEVVFHWLAARLSGCPVSAGIRGRYFFEPCVGLDVGQLQAQGLPGANIEATKIDRGPWVAAALVGRARATLVDPLSVEVEAGLVLPLLRDRYTFRNPDHTLWEVPGVTGTAALGLCLHFP